MARTLTSRRLTCPSATCHRYLTIARGYDCSAFPACDAARGDQRDPSRKDPS